MILIDTREKTDKIKHITGYFDKHGIPHDRTKLYIGDYQRADNPLLLIDRKQNLMEIATNIVNDHGRFKRELDRLSAIGAKMCILVEEKPDGIEGIEDVAQWKSPVKKDGTPYVRMSGATLYKYMKSWQYKHNIEFVFCHKNGTPGKILELLEVDKNAAD